MKGFKTKEIEINISDLPEFIISGSKFRIFFDFEKDELVYISDDTKKWLSPKELKIFIRRKKLEKISKL